MLKLYYRSSRLGGVVEMFIWLFFPRIWNDNDLGYSSIVLDSSHVVGILIIFVST